MQRAFWTSLFYLVFGLAFGVFYREYTRLMDFNGDTTLSFTHSHILTLGFGVFLLVIVLDRFLGFTSRKYYTLFFWIYNVGLMITLLALISRGILDVHRVDFSFLPYIAGMGHIIISLGLAFFMKVTYDGLKSRSS